MKKTPLNLEKLIGLDNNFVIQTTQIKVTEIKKNINNFSLELNINEINILGNAYRKNELLDFSYNFGKKIYRILKSSLKTNIYSEFIKSNSLFEINKITNIQKEKILDLYENLFNKYDLIINIPYLNYNTSIIIPFFNEKNDINLLKISEKFIIIFIIFDFYKSISYLYENTNSNEYALTETDINNNIKKIKNICNIFFENRYFINIKDTNEFLLVMFQTLKLFTTEVFNVLSCTTSINPFSTYTTNSMSILLFSSSELLDLALFVLIDVSIAISNSTSIINVINQVYTCPLCNKSYIKTGKKDIICPTCRKTHQGKKFIKNRHIENKLRLQLDIISDFKKIKNPSPQLINNVNKIKTKITDHKPTMSDLNTIRCEINKILNL